MGTIIESAVSEIFNDRYAEFGAAVLLDRAIPAVEDGLLPVTRRILFTFYREGKFTNFRKATAFQGSTMLIHPHGDNSLYESMVKLTQRFNKLNPLIISQGNNGNVNGDSFAAPRYLEMKIAPFTLEALFEDIDKDTIDMKWNYDQTIKEPERLSSTFPLILNWGVSGIGSGFACDIPPHNIREIVDATTAVIDNPDITSEEIVKKHLRGPDYPTGATILNASDLPAIYAKGNGQIKVQGTIQEVKFKNRQCLEITALPYKVTAKDIVEQITNLCKENKDRKNETPLLREYIADIKNATKKMAVSIIIVPKKDADINVLRNLILQNTNMTVSESLNMNILVGGQFVNSPSIKTVLEAWVASRIVFQRRKFNSLIRQYSEQITLASALLKAQANIDEVIKIVKTSTDKDDAKKKLMAQFSFFEKEAEHIVTIPLFKIAKVEVSKLKEKIAEYQEKRNESVAVISDVGIIREVIKAEMAEIVKTHGKDKRQTVLTNTAVSDDIRTVITEKALVVAISTDGYIYAKSSEEMRLNSRGNKGTLLVDSKRNKIVEKSFAINTHDELFCFTDTGKLFVLYGYQLDVDHTHINSLIPELNGAKIVSLIPILDKENGNLIFCTRNSYVKKCALADFMVQRRSGLLAAKLNDGDALIGVELSLNDDDDIVIIPTTNGSASKILISNLPMVERTTKGRPLIRLKNGEVCTSINLTQKSTEEETKLLLITATGKGKLTPVSDLLYKKTETGMSAAFLAVKLDQGDTLLKGLIVGPTDDVVISTKMSKTIRIDTSQINTYSRQAKGYRLITLNDGDSVATFATVDRDN